MPQHFFNPASLMPVLLFFKLSQGAGLPTTGKKLCFWIPRVGAFEMYNAKKYRVGPSTENITNTGRAGLAAVEAEPFVGSSRAAGLLRWGDAFPRAERIIFIR